MRNDLLDLQNILMSHGIQPKEVNVISGRKATKKERQTPATTKPAPKSART